jgi:hypothetical protein
MANFKKFTTLLVKELPKQIGMNVNNGAKVEILPVPTWIDMDEVIGVQRRGFFECDENSDIRKYMTEHNIKDLYTLLLKRFTLINVIGPFNSGDKYFDTVLEPTI